MNWINLNVAILDSDDFLSATPTARATWLCLLRYCHGQENGGRITGAARWSTYQCQQILRVNRRDIHRSCPLWRWDGDDLIVCHYPEDKQHEVQQRRESARANGRLGGRPRKPINDLPLFQTSPHAIAGKPTSVSSGKAEGEEEREENEIEIEREASPSPVDIRERVDHCPAAEPSPEEIAPPENDGPPSSSAPFACPELPLLATGGVLSPAFQGWPTREQALTAAADCGISEDVAKSWWLTRQSAGWVRGSAYGVVPIAHWPSDLELYFTRSSSSNPARKAPSRKKAAAATTSHSAKSSRRTRCVLEENEFPF